eukprot:TRINITY_DN1037_c0_g1_i10.p1 TRINITY_DN1037_c0_g1~~TRINITY_DN1037_c0_g1_i10.p1  ORF type:complete len:211 (+),score=24.07 TRINITY_DN1037_c0_g1_i10:637-1269(+)
MEQQIKLKIKSNQQKLQQNFNLKIGINQKNIIKNKRGGQLKLQLIQFLQNYPNFIQFIIFLINSNHLDNKKRKSKINDNLINNQQIINLMQQLNLFRFKDYQINCFNFQISKINFQVLNNAKKSEQQSRLGTRTKESYLYARIKEQSKTYIRKETERSKTVSYTHLTLPTICSVQISVVAVSLKKKKSQMNKLQPLYSNKISIQITMRLR